MRNDRIVDDDGDDHDDNERTATRAKTLLSPETCETVELK